MPFLLTILLGIIGFCHTLAARETMRLWGQVRHGSTGVPAAQVIAVGQDTSWCDESGNYSFPALNAGRLQLKVSAAGYAPLRMRLWLRREAFLALDIQPEQPLTNGFPADSLRTLSPALAAPRDLDRDGREDHSGWLPLLQPDQVLEAGLPREDPWGGLWSEPASQGVGLDAHGALWQPLGLDGFFSLRNLAGWKNAADDSRGRQIWLEGVSSGSREMGLREDLRLGPWHEGTLRLALSDAAHQKRDVGTDQQGVQIALDHRWLAARALQLSQRLQLGSSQRSHLSSDTPWLWLPLSSVEGLRDAELSQRHLSWLGRAAWLPAESTSGELLAWWRLRSQESRGWEEDRLLHRLLVQEVPEGAERGWFPTRRDDERTAFGLRAALLQQHARGWLQGALSLETQQRRLDASLDSMEWLPSGRHPWFSLEEAYVLVEGRLRDHWQWSPRLSIEACLDLRYHYYDVRRRPVALFQLSDVPDVAFNQDLLALEPRFALGWQPGAWALEGSWQRRLSMPGPASAWDLGRSPERLADLPLVAAIGSEGEVETLLPAIRLDEFSWAGARALWPGAQLRLGLWGRSWRNLPLAGWTTRGEVLDPGQLTQPMNAIQGGADACLELRGDRWHGSLQGRWNRARLRGVLWQPLPDTSLWLGRSATLSRLPGQAAWSAALELGARIEGVGLRMDPTLTLQGMGARDPENQSGWTRELPASLRLDAELCLALRSQPAWTLTLWGRNLGQDRHAALGWVEWRAAEFTRIRHDLPSTARLIGLRLTWEPVHE